MQITELEADLETWCRKTARQRGCWLLKFVSPGNRSVPDRILIAPGGTVFMEFKRLGKKPTPKQANNHKLIREAGGTVYVIDNRDTFVEILSTLSE